MSEMKYNTLHLAQKSCYSDQVTSTDLIDILKHFEVIILGWEL
jgi:hypothetical protein